jgi:hypothetical protein
LSTAHHQTRLQVAALSTDARQPVRGGVIARRACAAVGERGEIEISDRKSLCSRLLVPGFCLHEVLRLALAMLQHRAQIVLRRGYAGIRRAAHPADRRRKILRAAASVAILERETELRERVPFERGLAVPDAGDRIVARDADSVCIKVAESALRVGHAAVCGTRHQHETPLRVARHTRAAEVKIG